MIIIIIIISMMIVLIFCPTHSLQLCLHPFLLNQFPSSHDVWNAFEGHLAGVCSIRAGAFHSFPRHPPVSRLGRAPGRLGHLGEASWEVACHNTNLRFFKELFVDISKLLSKTEGPVHSTNTEEFLMVEQPSPFGNPDG